MRSSVEDICSTGMFSDDEEGDYNEKCRKRRQRRIQIMRRQQPKLLLLSSGGSISSSYLGQRKMETMVGAMSVSGRQRVMEDAISIRTNLCSPEINRWRPLDFFAIYDGHGGSHVNPTVASLCSERMHILLGEELMRVRNNVDMSGSCSSRGRRQPLGGQRVEEAWKRVLTGCFSRIDEMASCTCSECGSVGYRCGCPPDELGLTGSTAVVAVLTNETIIVANCGDSRAVLSRRGSAIPLSYDHKPDRQEERSRIESCGGRVLFADGARVEGILGMSRAIGDRYLKPYVTSEPEITFTKREAEDECLILASDGLWDVISSEMACEVARECLREEDPAGDHSFSPLVEGVAEGALFSSRSASAAALLTRLALGRNSYDNISVIVVDLKRNHTGV
ncbi:probable protein phosphatase 2C 75 isoform X1 [Lycium ferocissimum]|uniref:probable protein phosphatase 2C 75 isoform X1 n=1 Tax=Lycium ferocissimum TaxID=112874 RepID=UPI002815BDAC|nr:probable protein phosphatase 2C 75 isoform X1 [Lycium ferocissimum]